MIRLRVSLALAIAIVASAALAQSPYLVKEINTTTSPDGSYPDDLQALGSLAIFTTNNTQSYPQEVWRSDGTAEGTFRIAPGRDPMVSNGKVWFIGEENALLYSDASQNPPTVVNVPGGSKPYAFFPASTGVYFGADDGFWRTDGTNTTKLQTIYPEHRAGTAMAGQTTLFITFDLNTHTSTLWGASGANVQVLNTFAGVSLHHFRAVGSLVYFYSLNSNTYRWQLWRSDGTAAGTFLVHGDTSPAVQHVATATHFYFNAGGKLWWTTGTPAGTGVIGSRENDGSAPHFPAHAFGVLANGMVIGFGNPVNPPVVPNTSFHGIYAFNGVTSTFLANIAPNNGLHGITLGNVFVYGGKNEFWRTDGTVGGTYKLADLTGDNGYFIWPRVVAGSQVFFSASDSVHGWELRKTDGSLQNTVLVEDIKYTTFPSYPRHFYALRGGAVFTARQSDGVSYDNGPRDLWFSDGTEGGTVKLLENFYPFNVRTCGGRTFFDYHTDALGMELWSTDGTPAGTGLLEDLWAGIGNAGPNSSSPNGFTCVDNVLYFFARNANGPGVWRSDGTAAGTFQMMQLPAGSQPESLSPVRYGHGFFFGVTSPNWYGELWASDGTAGGTRKIKTLDSGSMSQIVVSGHTAYFTLFGGVLWRSNGTADTTTPVPMQGRAFTVQLYPFNGRVAFGMFQGTNPESGYCQADAGGMNCFDVLGTSSSWTFGMMPLNGRLYYNKSGELWSTDGFTPADTGAPDADKLLTVAGGRLYYVRTWSGSSYPLMESDGTAVGTRTLWPRQTYDALASGGRLFIGSDELYAYDLPVTPVSLSPATVPAGAGGQVVISGRGFLGPVSIDIEGTPASVVSVTPTAITFNAPAREAGSYEVKLITGDGRHMTTDERLTYTCTRPTAASGASPAAVCPMAPVQLQGSGGTRCSWFPATGLDNPNSCTPVAKVAETTTYTLVVSSASGCPSNNHPTVTVNVNPSPNPAIGFPLAPPGNSIPKTFSTHTAAVADAGPGATYAWTVQGADLSGPSNERTVSFTTRCEKPTLKVVVTNGAGCSATSTQTYNLISSLAINSITPRAATPGAVITVTGNGYNCLTEVNLQNAQTFAPAMPVPFTIVSPTSLTFRMPFNAPPRSRVQLTNPFNAVSDNQGLVRITRDDFTGDGTTDLLLRNSTTGFTQHWSLGLNGSFASARIWRDAGTTDFNVVGVHDFGFAMPWADILWQRTSTRQLSIQFSSTTTETVIPNIPAADQVVAAVADLNGNGLPELIMRNTTTGATQMWTFVTNDYGVSMTTIHGGNNLQWQIVGSRDFNGDGRHDLLWRNTSTGALLMWLMNGAAIQSSTMVHNGGNTGWNIVGLGDFNGDTYADILWRNTSTGMTLLWRMNGPAILGSTAVHNGGNTGWNIAGVGDFNADGLSDVLWRESASGMTLYWQMNGAAITRSVVLFQSLPAAEKIEGPRM